MYKISSHGRVFSVKSKKFLSHKTKKGGYQKVQLRNNSKVAMYYIHRLVALHFIENLSSKPQVNHKNGDKTNNNKSNLEWVTSKENIDHARKSGLIHYNKWIITI